MGLKGTFIMHLIYPPALRNAALKSFLRIGIYPVGESYVAAPISLHQQHISRYRHSLLMFAFVTNFNSPF